MVAPIHIRVDGQARSAASGPQKTLVLQSFWLLSAEREITAI